MTTQWQAEFGGDYAIPAALDALAEAGELIDISWHNDVCPSFASATTPEPDIRLWVQHPEREHREMDEVNRFLVIEYAPDSTEMVRDFDTDDLDEALKTFREWVSQHATAHADPTKTYYDVEVRSTNHPDIFTSQDVLWDTRERAEQEAERLRKWWPPLLEARVVEWKS